ARLAGFRAQSLDDRRIRPLRHEADVLAVGLGRDRQREIARQPAGLVLRQTAQRKAQEIELAAAGAIKKVALVAARIGGTMQFRPIRPGDAARVMPGRQRAGAELPRGPQQIAKLDALVAADARDRRLAAAIGLGEILDYRRAEARLVIEHVMRDTELGSDTGRVAHILPGAARALFADRRAMIVKLQS